MITIDKDQGMTEDEYTFGYISDSIGGWFFTWCDTLPATLATLEPDEIDPPRIGRACAERELRRAYRAEALLPGSRIRRRPETTA